MQNEAKNKEFTRDDMKSAAKMFMTIEPFSPIRFKTMQQRSEKDSAFEDYSDNEDIV